VESTVAQPVTAPSDGEAAEGGDNGLREPQYALLLSLYSAALGGFLLWRQRTKGLPTRISATDLLLIGVATHKGSRLLAKDKVTAPLRRPFAAYEAPAGPGEVEDTPRGTGLRYAIGELLVCPYCLGQWVATAFACGLLVAPRLTRFIASILAVVTASDFLQVAYKAGEEKL
jgi:Protein of unknown function (DUF1360)